MVKGVAGRGVASQSEFTIAYRLRACDECSDLVGLDFVTNAYESSDLGLGQPQEAFTNHYRREQGTHN